MPLAKVQGEYSYADYLTWPEDERWEIIDGTAYLQAVPSPLHQEVLTELLTQIHQQFSGKTCRSYPAPFCVRLAEKDQEDKNIKMVVEPDITIVCDQSKVVAKGYHGVPDMIIEIISPASIKMDRFFKFNAYETVGVREYWIVEPEGCGADVSANRPWRDSSLRCLSAYNYVCNDRFTRPL